MALIERVLVQRVAKPLTKVIFKLSSRSEASVDSRNVLGTQILDPTCVVDGLRDDIARRAITLYLDKDQGSVWRNCQEIDPPPMTGLFLASDQHPFVR
jgi:hypothetical protein